jgi:hypothetical protein
MVEQVMAQLGAPQLITVLRRTKGARQVGIGAPTVATIQYQIPAVVFEQQQSSSFSGVSARETVYIITQPLDGSQLIAVGDDVLDPNLPNTARGRVLKTEPMVYGKMTKFTVSWAYDDRSSP